MKIYGTSYLPCEKLPQKTDGVHLVPLLDDVGFNDCWSYGVVMDIDVMIYNCIAQHLDQIQTACGN